VTAGGGSNGEPSQSGSLRLRGLFRDEQGWRQDPDSAPGAKVQQVAVARDDRIGITFGSSLQHSVISGVILDVGDAGRRLDDGADASHLPHGVFGHARLPLEFLLEDAP